MGDGKLAADEDRAVKTIHIKCQNDRFNWQINTTVNGLRFGRFIVIRSTKYGKKKRNNHTHRAVECFIFGICFIAFIGRLNH